MVDVEDDGTFDGEIRRKVTRKTFKIEEVSAGSKIRLFRVRLSDDRIFSRWAHAANLDTMQLNFTSQVY